MAGVGNQARVGLGGGYPSTGLLPSSPQALTYLLHRPLHLTWLTYLHARPQRTCRGFPPFPTAAQSDKNVNNIFKITTYLDLNLRNTLVHI